MTNENAMSRGENSGEEKHHHGGKSSESLLDKEPILKALNIQPGLTILDAGCGNGYMSKIFSEKVTQSGKVYALDPDTESIEILKKEALESNIEAMEGDITRPTPLNSSSIDLIYLSTVFHGFMKQEIPGFVKEAKRLLKPNGVLAIVEIEKKETPFGPPMNIRFSPEELRNTIPLAPVNTIQVGEHFYMQVFRKM